MRAEVISPGNGLTPTQTQIWHRIDGWMFPLSPCADQPFHDGNRERLVPASGLVYVW